MKVKSLTGKEGSEISISKFPNFSITGSITGMRKIYGKNCMLVKCGKYIYNVDEYTYNLAT